LGSSSSIARPLRRPPDACSSTDSAATSKATWAIASARRRIRPTAVAATNATATAR